MQGRWWMALVAASAVCGGCAFNVPGLSLVGDTAGASRDLGVAADLAEAADLVALPDLIEPPDLLPCVRVSDSLATPSGAWVLKGDARWDAARGRLELTSNGFQQRGTAFYNAPIATPGLDARFDIYIGDGSGADGLALVLAKANDVNALAPSGTGNALGYVGLDGWGIRFDTFGNFGDPGTNWVGLTRAKDGSVVLSGTDPPSLACGCTRKVHVRVTALRFLLEIDGEKQIDEDLPGGVSLDGTWFVGFAASSGGVTDRHAVSNLELVAGSAGICF